MLYKKKLWTNILPCKIYTCHRWRMIVTSRKLKTAEEYGWKEKQEDLRKVCLQLRAGGQHPRTVAVHKRRSQFEVPGRQNLPGQFRKGLVNFERFCRYVRLLFHLFHCTLLPLLMKREVYCNILSNCFIYLYVFH